MGRFDADRSAQCRHFNTSSQHDCARREAPGGCVDPDDSSVVRAQPTHRLAESYLSAMASSSADERLGHCDRVDRPIAWPPGRFAQGHPTSAQARADDCFCQTKRKPLSSIRTAARRWRTSSAPGACAGPWFGYGAASGLSGYVQEGPSEAQIWGGASGARGTRTNIDERVP
jgi:hypothetical protein